MKLLRLITTAVLFALVTGCSAGRSTIISNSSSPTNDTTPPTQTATSVKTETPEITPTFTQTVPTNTPTGTSTLTPTPALNILTGDTDCIRLEDTWNPDGSTSGYAVLKNMDLDNEEKRPEIYWVDMATGESYTTRFGYNFVVSPDQKTVVYDRSVYDEGHKVLSQDLVVAAPDGSEIIKYPWQDEWSSIVGWLDSQHLIISLDQYNGSSLSIKTDPSPVTIFNLTTGEEKTRSVSFPELLFPEAVLPNWGGTYGVSYSYDLTRALYPRYLDDTKEMFAYALWDMENNSLIVTLDDVFKSFSIYNIFHQPFWSANNEYFALVGMTLVLTDEPFLITEIYVVTRNGDVTQITTMSPQFRPDRNSLAISPNGQYISFNLTTESSVSEKHGWAAYVDLETNSIINTCIPIGYHGVGGLGGELLSAIWSPDSSKVLVTDWYEEDHNRVILIDFALHTAYVVAHDAQPVAWMTNP